MNKNSQCYLNGKVLPTSAATVSVLDRGFLFGDGVYEVVPIYDGNPFCWGRHIRRLAHSLAEIRIPAATDTLLAAAQELIGLEAEKNCALYIQITRGAAERRHTFPQPPPSPTVFMMILPRPPLPPQKISHGVACKTMKDLRWLRADIKSVSLLGSVLAAQEAAENEVEEMIGIREDIVSEAATCNILLAANGKLLTPLADNRILPGITREIILQLAQENNIEFEERDISEAMLRNADELMLASSSREILPITMLDDLPVGDGRAGKMFSVLQAAYRNFIVSGRE